MRWSAGITILLLGVISPAILAHDIPNARIDRSTQVSLGKNQIQVSYEVALAELTLAQDLRQLDETPFVGDRAALFDHYAGLVGPLNARGFLITVDGTEIELRSVEFAIHVEDHLRIAFEFAATIPTQGHLRLTDTNYASSEGSTRLGLRVAPALVVAGDLPPTEVSSVPWRPVWEMTDQQERQSKQLDIAYRPRDVVADRIPVSLATPISLPLPQSPAVGLTRLLDRPAGIGAVGWLISAFVLGAVHAIQPGHGKTLVAAATLDGSRGAARGVALGLITASCHLISVAAIAALLWWVESKQVTAIHLTIARASGCLIAAVGAFRAGRALAGIKQPHDHGGTGRRNASVWTLGLAGGFVPCWDAVALVVLASSIGQLSWGLTLLVAFSLGLAAVLVGVGLVAAQIRSGIERAQLSGDIQRWLGLGSSLILLVIGLRLLGV